MKGKRTHFRLTAAHKCLCGAVDGNVAANIRLVTCPACLVRYTPAFAAEVATHNAERQRQLAEFGDRMMGTYPRSR